MTTKNEAKTGLDLLREPFPPHQISKLPKPTKAQTEEVKANFRAGIRCQLCGAWHHPDVVHLDYVGHAALTSRLLDADPNWVWEPVAFRDGLPAFDHTGGLWIKLTVCGVTRLGYGHAAGKSNQDPGAREKEVIGDALRNAAMRFGAALDLWHKGDLHGTGAEDDAGESTPAQQPAQQPEHTFTHYPFTHHLNAISSATDIGTLQAAFATAWRSSLPDKDKADLKAAYEQKKAELQKPDNLADGFVPPDFDGLDART